MTKWLKHTTWNWGSHLRFSLIFTILAGYLEKERVGYQYRKYRCGDKNCVRLSYFSNTGNMASLYWFPALLNTLRLRQNGRHFADNLLRCIFLGRNIWIWIKISLKFVPKGPINDFPALVQTLAWHQIGNKPLSEPMLIWFTDAYVRH